MKKYQLSSWNLSEIKPVNLQKAFQEVESKPNRLKKGVRILKVPSLPKNSIRSFLIRENSNFE